MSAKSQVDTFGTRPSGACPPDGSHIWAESIYSPSEQTWTFITHIGWLISSTTRTDNAEIAHLITDSLRGSLT